MRLLLDELDLNFINGEGRGQGVRCALALHGGLHVFNPLCCMNADWQTHRDEDSDGGGLAAAHAELRIAISQALRLQQASKKSGPM